jgi:hypothetical protein
MRIMSSACLLAYRSVLPFSSECRISNQFMGANCRFGFIFGGAIGRAIACRYSYLLEESPGSGEQAAR